MLHELKTKLAESGGVNRKALEQFEELQKTRETLRKGLTELEDGAAVSLQLLCSHIHLILALPTTVVH